jgi:hypothetical protein
MTNRFSRSTLFHGVSYHIRIRYVLNKYLCAALLIITPALYLQGSEFESWHGDLLTFFVFLLILAGKIWDNTFIKTLQTPTNAFFMIIPQVI